MVEVGVLIPALAIRFIYFNCLFSSASPSFQSFLGHKLKPSCAIFAANQDKKPTHAFPPKQKAQFNNCQLLM